MAEIEKKFTGTDKQAILLFNDANDFCVKWVMPLNRTTNTFKLVIRGSDKVIAKIKKITTLAGLIKIMYMKESQNDNN